MPNKEPAIIVKDVKKSFKIPLDGSTGIKQRFLNFYKQKKGYRTFEVLKEISFEVEKGEFFGIVGRNGSGKSTLLKMLAGVYKPDSGAIAVNGSLTPFIELGVGFNPELSGRENVYLNGALLGFNHKEMDAMYDDIVDFAELHDFMEEKLKNYSSGMQVRLAFSIAIRADTDILLLDEVLAVGDEAFQRKCYEYFAQLKQQKKTVILVTHAMDNIERFCSRAILINDGVIEKIGNPRDIAMAYEDLNRQNVLNEKLPETGKQNGLSVDTDNTYFSADINLVDGKDNPIKQVTKGERLRFRIHLMPNIDLNNAFVGLQIRKTDGESVYRAVTEAPNKTIEEFKKDKPVTVILEVQNIFAESGYTVDVTVKSVDRTKEYLVRRNVVQFINLTDDKVKWNLQPDYSITIR